MQWLVVGLGNPGAEYRRTRHNIGFMVLDTWAEILGVSWKDSTKKFGGMVATGCYKKTSVVLLKPSTFMNQSGQSISAVCSYYQIVAERVLIVHDEVDLPLAKIKLKCRGGDGGHKGIRSAVQHVHTKEFGRLRFGIGRPLHGEIASYVLAVFSKQEKSAIEGGIAQSVQCIESVLAEGMQQAMNRWNGHEASSLI